jgi:uncharacterized protein (TIGR03435 family)
MTLVRRRKLLAVIAISLAAALQSGAQPPVKAEFEVASVKPVGRPVGPNSILLRILPGRLNVNAAALRQITGLAYAIQRVRVEGGPGWMDTELYDIVAKAEDPAASVDQIRAMLQTLLADRFKLVVHRETKELDVYSLVVGKNGSKLQEAKEEEKTGFSPGMGRTGPQWAFQKMPIAGLVNTLANMMGSPVLDKTDLKGFYNFKLEFTDPRFQRPGNPNEPQSLDAAPDLFGALQEQLGLKLEKKKGPGEVLIVDHAERASEN